VSTVSPSAFLTQLTTLPRLGLGLALKDALVGDLLDHLDTTDLADQVAWLELIPENYMGRGGQAWENLLALQDAGFPLTSHGVAMSLGSADGLEARYLDDLTTLFEHVPPVWFSDHLSYARVGDRHLNDLFPLPFVPEAVAQCVQAITQVKARFAEPFLIENISYYTRFTPEAMDEAAFLTQVVEGADCGLLLDVNNVVVNCLNHGGDPWAFVQALPLERVVEIHVAGHLVTPTLVIDTHGATASEAVVALLSRVAPRCPNLKGILLERDVNLPPFAELLQELHHLRDVLQTTPTPQPLAVMV